MGIELSFTCQTKMLCSGIVWLDFLFSLKEGNRTPTDEVVHIKDISLQPLTIHKQQRASQDPLHSS